MNVGITGDHTHDMTFQRHVDIDSIFGSLPTQNFIFTWADVTKPTTCRSAAPAWTFCA